MKKITLILVMITYSLNFFGQQTVNNNLLKINIITPGLTYENAIGIKETLCLDSNISLVPTASAATGIAKTIFTTLQYRNYYNVEKRLRKGKNINGNSANYIALNSSYYFKTIGDDDFVNNYDGITAGATWGLQRTYKNGFNINLNAGLGYNFSNRKSKIVSPIVPIVNFTIGWVIFKN